MVAIPLSPQRKESKESTKTTLFAEYFIDIDLSLMLPVLTSFRLGRNRFLCLGQIPSLSLTVNLHVLDSGYC
ncbi:hypothetical protein H8958_007283 [Nasalis larvatus]|uniref:Uncharacterized protein n=3 Tax=Colobinae TaxID=9569 RepID=A0A2K6JUB0_RHIBE